MAKFEKADENVVSLFDEIREKTTIPLWVNFEVLSNSKQKQLYRIVRMNDLVQAITEGIDFAIVFNEEIFDQLTDEQKEMAITECLAGVSVSENDGISLEKPNFSTYTGVLEKYGHDPIIVLHESVKSLFDAKSQKEAQEKAANGGKRGRKRKVF